jgi:O-antigen ligase
MKPIVNFGVFSYVFFVSWNGVFALHEWVRVPFVLLLLTLCAFALHLVMGGRLLVRPYSKIDYLLPAFFVAFSISAFINQNESSLNYLIAYFFVFFILYLLFKGILYSCVTSRQIHVANTWGVIFVGAFLSLNFILSSAGLVNLQEMMPRVKDASAIYLEEFNRGYGFSTEPGVVAYYLNTLGPLALWFLWRETSLLGLIKSTLTLIVIFGWFVTFSAAGFAFLVVSLFVSYLILNVRIRTAALKAKQVVRVVIVSMTLLGAGGWAASQPVVQDFMFPIFMKLTLSEDLRSSEHRTERWSESAGMVLDRPFFGYGPRYFSAEGESSALNWFLMLLVEGGFISFLIMLLFLYLVMVKMIRFRHPARMPYLVGFLAGCGHLMATSTFYHPFLWLLIAIFFVQQAHVMKLKQVTL